MSPIIGKHSESWTRNFNANSGYNGGYSAVDVNREFLTVNLKKTEVNQISANLAKELNDLLLSFQKHAPIIQNG